MELARWGGAGARCRGGNNAWREPDKRGVGRLGDADGKSRAGRGQQAVVLRRGRANGAVGLQRRVGVDVLHAERLPGTQQQRNDQRPSASSFMCSEAGEHACALSYL